MANIKRQTEYIADGRRTSEHYAKPEVSGDRAKVFLYIIAYPTRTKFPKRS